MKRFPFVATLPLVLLLGPQESGAGVQWTETTRIVGSESIVSSPSGFALDGDNQSNEIAGLFSATALADTMIVGVTGSASSTQDSELLANGFLGTGSFQTTTEVTDPDGFADVFGRSIFNGYFDLDESTDFSLTGVLINGGAGTSTQMALFGPGGAVVNVMAFSGETETVDATGTLTPGSYLVLVSAAGNAQEAPPELMTEASGEWEMTFALGTTVDAPLAAASRALRVFPNPASGSTTIALASPAADALVRVHDAAGRLVRTLRADAGTARWDTRDAVGRPLPSGVYFLTVREGDEFSTGRVTVLR